MSRPDSGGARRRPGVAYVLRAWNGAAFRAGGGGNVPPDPRAGVPDRMRANDRLSSSPPSAPQRRAHAGARGLTVLELMIGLAILGVLAAIALPAYTDYRERLRVYQAVSEIGELQTAIDRYIDDNRAPPASLAQINRGGMLDPWGRPYQYLDLTTSPPGAARKNRNLVPINSSYDLYSVGKDGDSVGPLTAKASRDDVVRANDGKFIGLAQDYEP